MTFWIFCETFKLPMIWENTKYRILFLIGRLDDELFKYFGITLLVKIIIKPTSMEVEPGLSGLVRMKIFFQNFGKLIFESFWWKLICLKTFFISWFPNILTKLIWPIQILFKSIFKWILRLRSNFHLKESLRINMCETIRNKNSTHLSLVFILYKYVWEFLTFLHRKWS